MDVALVGLAAELTAMAAADHQGAAQAHSEDPVAQLAWRRLTAQHADRLTEIMDEHGWPTAALVGADGARAAWLIAQHADRQLDVQRRALALMTAAVSEAPPALGTSPSCATAPWSTRVARRSTAPRSPASVTAPPSRSRARTRIAWTPAAPRSAFRPSRSMWRSSRWPDREVTDEHQPGGFACGLARGLSCGLACGFSCGFSCGLPLSSAPPAGARRRTATGVH